jgi:hypothetical protein
MCENRSFSVVLSEPSDVPHVSLVVLCEISKIPVPSWPIQYLDPQLIFQGYRQSMERSDCLIVFGEVGAQLLCLRQSRL